MDTKKALQIYKAIIEQGMSAGLFKKLTDINTAQQSLEVLQSAIENQSKGNDRKHQTEQP